MKKIYFLLFLGMFMINNTFSQMSFKGNSTQKSAFDLTEKKLNMLNNKNLDTKVLITAEENDMMAKRRRSSRSRGSSSEGGLYASFGLGYGLGLGSQNIDGFTDQTSTKTSTTLPASTTEDQINFSLGKGLCINGAFGYMINGNLGFELGFSYLIGGKNTATNTENENTTETIVTYTTNTIKKNETVTTYNASMFRLSPSVIISSGMEGINPYAKFGMTIGFGSFYKEASENGSKRVINKNSGILLYDSTTISSSLRKDQYSGGVAIGFNATLGCAFTVSDNISIFAEFNMINMSYSPTMSEVTEYNENGVNQIPSSITAAQKQTYYYDTLTSSTTFDPNASPIALKQSFSFGSIGLNIGMKISF
ncbi:MAG: hypothetical protein HXX18_10435 [Bacteroidetes bacterium]|nr:hypothetical protein [Bacteroidota bacterium]